MEPTCQGPHGIGCTGCAPGNLAPLELCVHSKEEDSDPTQVKCCHHQILEFSFSLLFFFPFVPEWDQTQGAAPPKPAFLRPDFVPNLTWSFSIIDP